jgi:hypothetical protein
MPEAFKSNNSDSPVINDNILYKMPEGFKSNNSDSLVVNDNILYKMPEAFKSNSPGVPGVIRT